MAVISHSQTFPIKFDKHPLVISKGIPEEFLLHSSDTATQILFNPARGWNFDRSFIYVNYLPVVYNYTKILSYNIISDEVTLVPLQQSSLGENRISSYPTIYSDDGRTKIISVAGFLLFEQSRWLFQLTNSVQSYSNDNASSATIQRTQNYLSENYQSYRNEKNQKNSQTEFRLSKIQSQEDDGQSFGVFAILSSQFGDGLFSRNENGSDYLPLKRSITRDDKGNNEQDYGQWQIGFEYTSSTKLSDVIFSASVSQNRNNILSKDYSYAQSIDSNSTPFYISTSIADANSKQDYKPYTFSSDVIYQRRIDCLTDNDYLFLNISPYYQLGEIDFSYNSMRKNRYQSGTTVTGDTVISSTAYKKELPVWGVKISSGFIAAKEAMDIKGVIGVIPQFSYEKIKTVSNSYNYYFSYYDTPPSIVRQTVSRYNVAVKLPIYLSYTPVHWFLINGGMTITYSYFVSSYETNSMSGNFYSSSIIYYNITSKSTSNSSSLNSSSDFYFSMLFKHQEGLDIQLSFNNNLNTPKYWNLSLGYYF